MSDARMLETGIGGYLLESGGYRAVEGVASGGGGAWDYDFTAMADGPVPTGWTQTANLEVASGIHSGMLRSNETWWQARWRMDTPTLTSVRRRITAEFQWETTDTKLEVGVMNTDGSSINVVSLQADGTWHTVRPGGFDAVSGTYTAPGLGVPFTVEWTWNNAADWNSSITVKVNGTIIGAGALTSADNAPPATAIYVTVFAGGQTGVRKVRYENPDATPPAVYTDNFNRPNGHLGADWTGYWNIASNKATRDQEFVRYAPPMPTTDHWIEADIDPVTQFFVINARGADSLGQATYMGFIDPGSGQAKIGMMNAAGGGYGDVALGDTGLTSAAYKGRLEVEGTAIRFYRNGVLVASATNSTLTTGRYVGFNASGNLGSMDNFRAGTLPYTP